MSRYSQVLFAQTASVTVANTVTETAILGSGTGTLTLPATGNPNIRVRVKLGAITVLDSGNITSGNGTNDGFTIQAAITCRTTGASGTVIGCGVYQELHSSGAVEGFNNLAGPITIDTTAAQEISGTVQWGSADSGNTIMSTNSSIIID